jgi:4-deoxy-L-threo-5-hexosulose-uronate ketol-isomerase
MKLYQMADPVRYTRMTTSELRETFLIEELFQPGSINCVYLDLDRAIVGSAVPLENGLQLETYDELRAVYFTERRELGVLNTGSEGVVEVDGKTYEMEHLSCLYIGRENPRILFRSSDPKQPAEFYLLSYPAHAQYPTGLVRKADVQPVEIGDPATMNRRRIYKCIHADGIASCQLVMGFTELEPGSGWNTMPPHTHMRRSEVYLYFKLPEQERIFHLMGPGRETRHLVIKSKQAVVSPGWSVHAGVGTSSYTFCWGMGGENQAYTDMDPIATADLK